MHVDVIGQVVEDRRQGPARRRPGPGTPRPRRWHRWHWCGTRWSSMSCPSPVDRVFTRHVEVKLGERVRDTIDRENVLPFGLDLDGVAVVEDFSRRRGSVVEAQFVVVAPGPHQVPTQVNGGLAWATRAGSPRRVEPAPEAGSCRTQIAEFRAGGLGATATPLARRRREGRGVSSAASHQHTGDECENARGGESRSGHRNPPLQRIRDADQSVWRDRHRPIVSTEILNRGITGWGQSRCSGTRFSDSCPMSLVNSSS